VYTSKRMGLAVFLCWENEKIYKGKKTGNSDQRLNSSKKEVLLTRDRGIGTPKNSRRWEKDRMCRRVKSGIKKLLEEL